MVCGWSIAGNGGPSEIVETRYVPSDLPSFAVSVTNADGSLMPDSVPEEESTPTIFSPTPKPATTAHLARPVRKYCHPAPIASAVKNTSSISWMK